MPGTQLAFTFPPAETLPPNIPLASGEKGKARDILAAIRTLKAIEQERRPATTDEKQVLARFGGFGPVALSIFPNPTTGRYKDARWRNSNRCLRQPNTTAPSAPPSTLFTRHRPSSPPCTRPSPEWAYPPTPRSSNPAAARAIS